MGDSNARHKREREEREESQRRRKSRFSDGPDGFEGDGFGGMPGPFPMAPAPLLNLPLAGGFSQPLLPTNMVPHIPTLPMPPGLPLDPSLAMALLAATPALPMSLPAGDDPASKAARAALVQAQIAQQIENVSSVLDAAQKAKTEKKARDFSLRLDEHGRQIDEKGQVVKSEAQIKTVKANIDMERFENNPYLDAEPVPKATADPRLKARSRDLRASRSFKFVQVGTYVKQGEAVRNREARKLMAGFLSGRNPNARHKEEIAHVEEENDNLDSNYVEVGSRSQEASIDTIPLPPAPDYGPIPVLEWWDQPFLSESDRKAIKKGEKSLAQTDLKLLDVKNIKTWQLIQHPGPVKTVISAALNKHKEVVVPVYLTKKERKRLRRQARLEREREKQDKIALGLMPPPEPKMKLSNFMKVIGEQAVADPSKVEKLVMAQVKARERNHEMRNQARKLTPQERKEKKRRKLQEDTSTTVHVAVFRVRDMSDPQKRFKVDVNAQQNNLTGGVLICKANTTNLVVVEGGPKAIKRFIKLMIKRIKWVGEGSDSESESDSDEEGSKPQHKDKNECNLVWEGSVLKRAFQAFRFQECKTSETARKVMEAKGVAHYWDMVVTDATAPKDAF